MQVIWYIKQEGFKPSFKYFKITTTLYVIR